MAGNRFLVGTIALLILLLICVLFFERGAALIVGTTKVTLFPIADAYVSSSNPDINYGNKSSLHVSSNSEFEYSYIMFDLSSIPTNANILSAGLSAYLYSTFGSIYGFPADKIGAYYCSDNSWNELGITWNNKPSFSLSPTSTWSFGIIYYLKEYKSWDVTSDVKTALPSGNLTEVLKFHWKTNYGGADFDSRETSNKPKLTVEYTAKPIFKIHFESSQDTGATNNFGFMAFAGGHGFPVPADVEVVEGEYQAQYDHGYMFVRWETTGGVTVSDVNSATTNVTISGEGTLRAVGNVKQLEYSYDGGYLQEDKGEMSGSIDAVRFTPLFSGQLSTARFCLHPASFQFGSTEFIVHVMDENRCDLITPFNQTLIPEGWFDVDLSSHGIGVNEGIDFYVGIEWVTNSSPRLGRETTDPFNRSWHWNGTCWEQETSCDFMIRAIVGTLIDHAIVADGTKFHILTESNSTVSNFHFMKEGKKLMFNLTGPTETNGFCNITIHNQLLGGPFNVTFDGQTLSEIFSFDNGTHTSLYFTYVQGKHGIEIVGTTVIPELPSFLLSFICITMTLAASIFGKKLKVKKNG